MSKTNNFSTPDQLLNSLAYELKNPLTLIARKAELEALSGDNNAFLELQDTAQQTLMLIDSYLLMARSEYGQVKLPIETVGVGSVVYEVLQELAPQANKNKILLNANVRDTTIMSNKAGLRAAIWCLTKLSMDFKVEPDKRNEVTISTREKKGDQAEILITSTGFNLDKKDLEKARLMQGSSRMALCLKNESSGIQLAIADILASSLGDGLGFTSKSGKKGFSLGLRKSHQLQLI